MARIWSFHAIALVLVLGASLAYLASNAPNLAVSLGFVWPIAAVYLAASTALVALFLPGRGGLMLAHAIALILAALAAPFLVTIR